MDFVADLHLHSKYSRAVSQQMILPEMARWGAKKGLNILTTGDWTHPLWMREIRNQLEEKEEGMYGLKSERDSGVATLPRMTTREPLFILTTEIASIYKEKEKLRRIHNLVFAPNFEVASKINKELVKRGCNIHSDGRPIVGISSRNLLEMILSIDKKAMLIPCHVWTPHFGIYGSASGYESLNEAFGDMDKYIYGIETGLSSDPEMNWQIEELKTRSILSFSDAHSLPKMGREATVFQLEKPTYENIRKAIMRDVMTIEDGKLKVGIEDGGLKLEKNINLQSSTFKKPSSTVHHLSSNRIIYTIEFYPEEGKYHFSGHRNCKVVFGPEEIKTKGNICPVCKRRLTEGVLYRLQNLSSENLLHRMEQKYNNSGLRWHMDKHKIHPPYVKLVPLNEIIAEALGASVTSEKVKVKFDDLCEEFNSEINILLKVPIVDLVKLSGEKIAEGIDRIRKGNIVIDPGYDGEYGHVKIWNPEAEKLKEEKVSQIDLGI